MEYFEMFNSITILKRVVISSLKSDLKVLHLNGTERMFQISRKMLNVLWKLARACAHHFHNILSLIALLGENKTGGSHCHKTSLTPFQNKLECFCPKITAWDQCYKTFLSVNYNFSYRLECLSLASLSSLV